MATLTEVRETVAAKRRSLHEIYEQAGPELDMSKVTIIEGDSAAKVAELQRRNTELSVLGKQLDELETLAKARETNASEHQRMNMPANGGMQFPSGKGAQQEPQARGLRQILQESKSYQDFREGRTKTATFDLSDIETKTLMTLTTINNPSTRLPVMPEYASEGRSVADLFLQGTTDNNTLTYMEETTFTNSAAETSEGSAKPESALAFTERTDNVRKIPTWLPATTELLSDVSGIQSYIEGRLRFMVMQRMAGQILVGDGTAPNLSGILDRSGIQTQAKGADPTPDAVFKAMTKIRSIAFSEPTGIVFHPNDWQDIKLLRTADGIYLWGSPSEAGPDRIWGMDVRLTTQLTENTGLVGAFKPDAQIFMREGLTVTVSSEHASYFIENKVAILAEMRLALAVYRPASFCTVTGI